MANVKDKTGGSMQVGDLIYDKTHNQYAIYLNDGGYAGWITVIRESGEKCQVIDVYWEAA